MNDLLHAESQLDVHGLSDVGDWNGEGVVAARVKKSVQQTIFGWIRYRRYNTRTAHHSTR